MWDIAGGIVIAVIALCVVGFMFAFLWSIVVGFLEAMDKINTPAWLLAAQRAGRKWLSHLRQREVGTAPRQPPSVR